MQSWKWVVLVPAFHFNIFLKVLHKGIKINLFFLKTQHSQWWRQIKTKVSSTWLSGLSSYCTWIQEPLHWFWVSNLTHRLGSQWSLPTEPFHWTLPECHLNLQSHYLSGRNSVRPSVHPSDCHLIGTQLPLSLSRLSCCQSRAIHVGSRHTIRTQDCKHIFGSILEAVSTLPMLSVQGGRVHELSKNVSPGTSGSTEMPQAPRSW